MWAVQVEIGNHPTLAFSRIAAPAGLSNARQNDPAVGVHVEGGAGDDGGRKAAQLPKWKAIRGRKRQGSAAAR